jgi:hypothetical protein
VKAAKNQKLEFKEKLAERKRDYLLKVNIAKLELSGKNGQKN